MIKPPTISETDARLVQVLDQYLAAAEAGRAPDKQELLAQYPDLAADLEACLRSLEFVKAASVKPVAAGAGVLEQSAPQPATGVLGDYRIIREIGRGGMGVVYEAEQISLGRRVALKVLPFAAVLDNKQLNRFSNEAHAAARLHHTNIVPVFSVGHERGVHYYAMQYIEGQPLSEVVRELRHLARCGNTDAARLPSNDATGYAVDFSLASQFASGHFAPPTPSSTVVATISTNRSVTTPEYFRTVASLATQVAEALEHAHENGVVHRDIKPSNLLLDAKGEIWITDFGLAQCQSEAGLTMTGDLVGTVRYMSPEQALAKRIPVDHRTDVYSLAATVYELLTLQPAFPGDDRQDLLRQITFDDPKPPRRINKSVPVELETITLKAMAKNPSSRYATAQEMADDLERFLADKPIRAKRPSIAERLAKFARRHRAVVTTAAVAASLMLVIVAVGASLMAIWLGVERNKVATERDAATRNLFQSHLHRARALRAQPRSGRYFQAMQALQEALKLAPVLTLGDHDIRELRNEAVAIMAQRADLQTKCEHTMEFSHWWKAFDSQLRYFVHAADSEGTLGIYRMDGGQLVRRLDLPERGSADFSQFSSDGRFLAVRYDRSVVRIWDVQDMSHPTVVCTARSVWEPHRCADFSQDSRLFAVMAPENTIQIYELPNAEAPGAKLKQSLLLPFQPLDLSFHPGGRKLALAHGTDVEIWDLESELVVRRFSHTREVIGIDWHPKGRYLAACTSDLQGHVWNLDSGERQAILNGVEPPVMFNHAGNLLATNSIGQVTSLWDPMSGELLVTAPARPVRFTSDDRHLAFHQNHSAGVWRVHHGAEYRLLLDRPEPGLGHLNLAFHPTHNLLAVSGGQRYPGTQFWDMQAACQVAEVNFGDGLMFQRAGRSMVTIGRSDIHRWPIAVDDMANQVRIGPPEKLDLSEPLPPVYRGSIEQSYDRLVGMRLDDQRAWLLNVQNPTGSVELEGQAGVATVVISPDEQWVVTTAWNQSGVYLWGARSGAFTRDRELWPDVVSSYAAFSPNGKWLVVSGAREYRCWSVGDWDNPRWMIKRDGAEAAPGPVALSPDGNLVTVRTSSLELLLVDMETGREVVTLQAPRHARALIAKFSPDGTLLAESNNNFLAVWDLRRVRHGLAELGLACDLPEYPPAREFRHSRPLEVKIDLGESAPVGAYHHRAWASQHGGDFGQAIADYRTLIKLNAKDTVALNNLAWLCVTGPSEHCDPQAALPLAEEAVKLGPDQSLYLNTLGVVYYRLNRFNDAIEQLTRSAKLVRDYPGGTAFDFFFLAMSYHRIGESDKARGYYDRAIKWCADQSTLPPTWAEELDQFRAEADAVLRQTAIAQ